LVEISENLWLAITNREGRGKKGKKQMYLSKIQVKNAVVKAFSKYSVSKNLKGRICYFPTSGYSFKEKEDGFIGISYFISNASYKHYEQDNLRREQRMTAVRELLTNQGFEFDGLDGFRKAKEGN
jgi:hypothetical protein